jgi:hypothetical protein
MVPDGVAPTVTVPGGPQSLAEYYQSHAPDRLIPFWPQCPTRGHLLLRHAVSGQIIRGRCGRLPCHACIAANVFDYGGAIGLASPDQMVTLTQVGQTWQQVRGRVARFRQILGRGGTPVEYAYHVELNPSGDQQRHLHMWMRGQVSETQIRDAATRGGMGQVALVTAHRPAPGEIPLLTYGMKACLQRPVGATKLWPAAEAFLEANGGRLLHATRRFWRDRDNIPLHNVRQAVRESRAARGRLGPWVPWATD